MSEGNVVKSVAIIGAGAAGKQSIRSLKILLYPSQDHVTNSLTGIITAVAFQAENYYERIRVFERRSTAGGTWYDISTQRP